MKVLCKIVCFSENCVFPVFFDGELQNSCRVSLFFGGISENGESDSDFALLGVLKKNK